MTLATSRPSVWGVAKIWAVWALAIAVAPLACGAPDPADEDRNRGVEAGDQPPVIRSGENDRIVIEIVAGESAENSYWNFNGLYGGEGRILVPLGAELEVDFRNADPAMSHSIGVTRWADPFPADFAPIEPAFPGALVKEAEVTDGAIAPEGRSVFRFRAMEEGRFAVVCFVPGHAAVGMFIRLDVVEGLAEVTLEH